MKTLDLGRLASAFALFVLLSCASAARAADSFGTLVGFVRGPGGVGMPGATVTARGADDRAKVSVVTGDNGAFRIDHLEPGTYTVDGEIQGRNGSGKGVVGSDDFEFDKGPSADERHLVICHFVTIGVSNDHPIRRHPVLFQNIQSLQSHASLG